MIRQNLAQPQALKYSNAELQSKYFTLKYSLVGQTQGRCAGSLWKVDRVLATKQINKQRQTHKHPYLCVWEWEQYTQDIFTAEKKESKRHFKGKRDSEVV